MAAPIEQIAKMGGVLSPWRRRAEPQWSPDPHLEEPSTPTPRQRTPDPHLQEPSTPRQRSLDLHLEERHSTPISIPMSTPRPWSRDLSIRPFVWPRSYEHIKMRDPPSVRPHGMSDRREFISLTKEETNHPRINDLMVELQAVNWHLLGLQLLVPHDKLEKIDEDYRLSDRKLSEVLQYWLQNDLSPSWDKICDALRRIGGFGRLVRELRMKYCSLKACHQQHAHGSEPAGANVAVCQRQVDSTIQDTIERLQRDFRELVAKIRSSLSDTVPVTAVKDLLRELPAGEVKDQVGLLLSNHFSDVMISDNIDQLFTLLSNIQAWDFLHPQLLEYFVQELGVYETKKIIREYRFQLIEFRRTTKMRELSGWFGNISETSMFKKIVLSLGNNWKEKTYEEFEVLRVSLLRQHVFFQSSMHLCGVLTGSILVALAIPNSIRVQAMEQMISEHSFLTFLSDNEISAVYAEGFCFIRDAHSTLAKPDNEDSGVDTP